jgi:pSer/pThr/pTyr-binding forkhead associated (FHA) protein
MEQLAWDSSDIHSDFVARVGGTGVLRPNETLKQADVSHGDILQIQRSSGQTIEPTAAVSQTLDQTYLQSLDTNETFVYKNQTMLVGRSPSCTINLSRMPGFDVVSRRQATVLKRQNSFWLRDENSTNGTIVDGVRLKKGESIRLRSGSQIQFGGEQGPVFVFYSNQENRQKR